MEPSKHMNQTLLSKADLTTAFANANEYPNLVRIAIKQSHHNNKKLRIAIAFDTHLNDKFYRGELL